MSFLIADLIAATVLFATLSYAETTVENGESNTSGQMSGGRGAKGAVELSPQPQSASRR